jgi:hypothetical protein
MRLTRVGLCGHCNNLKETEREYGENKRQCGLSVTSRCGGCLKAAAAAAAATRRPLWRNGLIAKADELPVHNRKGVGNQKEKGMDFYFYYRGVSSFRPNKLYTYRHRHMWRRREEENLGPPNNFKNEKWKLF